MMRDVRSGPWPANAEFEERGLHVGGIAADALAARFGTPLLVVDEEDFRARCRAFADSFPRVMFAVKAFPIRPLIRIALDEGLGLLGATAGEVDAALRAGAPADRIALHGNNKSDPELELAVTAGLGWVIVDNSDELERLDRIARDAGRRQPVLIRVIPGVEGHTHAYVDTGGERSKFGTPIAEGLALQGIKLASTLSGLELRGLHAHVGSQLLSAEPFLAEADALLDLLAEARDALGLECDVLDVGGGFGAVYTDEVVPDPAAIADAVLDHIRTGTERRGLRMPEVVVEPGRALTANAALTLYRVGSVKRTPGGPAFAAVDGGMSDNIRPALYGARHSVAQASGERTRERTSIRVVGKHCESGDVFGDFDLPADLGPGDLLVFGSTGAYTYAMASNYNRVGRPAVVGLGREGASLWLRREDVADLDRLDVYQAPEPGQLRAPPAGVEIRPARPRDAASFVEALQAVAGERRYIATETVTRSARETRKRFRRSWTDLQASIVAVHDGRVIGSLGIRREGFPVYRHIASLGMSVVKEWRGRGIGTALLTEALRWARSVGVEKVSLTVYPHNTRAIALYRAFGFVDEGRLSGQSKKSYGYEDEVIMSRWLFPRGDPR
jgi:diaminopimelate decarboxylase